MASAPQCQCDQALDVPIEKISERIYGKALPEPDSIAYVLDANSRPMAIEGRGSMARLDKYFGFSIGGGAALALLIASTGPVFAGPFSQFEGDWTGNGSVTADNGTKERLRCKAHYQVGGGGTTLSQNLTCASDSYKFNVVSNVTATEAGAIDGTWEETSRNATGHIQGKIGATQISAQVDGTGFSARIGIAARGGKQSVTISPTGADISNVSVTMSKN